MENSHFDIKSVSAVIERLKAVYEVRSDSELCRSLNVRRQTLSNWKARDSMPYSECVQVAEDKDIYLDWLILGIGPKSRDQLEEPWHPYLAIPDPEEREIIAELKKLPSDVKHELLENARMKGKVYELEEAVAKLQNDVQSIAEQSKDEKT